MGECLKENRMDKELIVDITEIEELESKIAPSADLESSAGFLD